MSARDRSPRPAEILPPTLLPNAVAVAAPPTDRLTSLLIACAVYSVMAAAVFSGARRLAVHKPGSTLPPVVIIDPSEIEPVRPQPRVEPPSGGGTRPPGVKVVLPPADANVIPVVTPTALPTVDHGGEVAGDPSLPVGPRVDGLPPGPPAAPPAPAVQATQAVNVEFQSLRILHQVAPVYPALARMVRIQGPVELRMTIDASGVPTDVQVISGPHPLLVAEALRVARLWRFQPALQNGVPTAATFRLTVGFRLA